MSVHYRVGEGMSFATSGISSSGYSESALRFGLMDIKPIQVIETIKKFGVKFRRITRTFESLEPSKSFSDLVYFDNEAIFGSIETPEWFDARELIKVYSQHSIEGFEKDTDLQREIENVREAERKGRPLLSFTQYVRQRFESQIDKYLEIEAHRFLASNFPFSVYNKFVVLDNTYSDFLKILEDIVRMHEFRASTSRNFRMYEKRLGEMKREISPLIEQFDKCAFSCSRLKKYISVWNSRDYKEIFYPDFLDIKNVDFSVFEKLSENSNTQLVETRQLLLRYKPEFLHKEFDLKDPTTKMFGKLVMLPQSSYSLKS